jgi:hypothetical protein
METNWHENSEKLLGAGQSMGNAVMLSFANIVVEVLKIFLYFIAVVLDTIKPLTGTRQRAGIAISFVVFVLIVWNLLGVGQILASITGWTNDSVEFKKEL